MTREETITRLNALVAELTDDLWLEGMSWYPMAYRKALTLGRRHGVPVGRVAGVIAAMSPRCRWERNLTDAESILETGTAAALGASVARARQILGGIDPLMVLGGPKTRAFYHNIRFPKRSRAVTLDTHMGRVLGIPGSPSDIGHYFDRAGIYDSIADGFRSVADEVGVLPHQLQAAVWTYQRG